LGSSVSPRRSLRRGLPTIRRETAPAFEAMPRF
jgi:hypothetical protein